MLHKSLVEIESQKNIIQFVNKEHGDGGLDNDIPKHK